VEVARRVADQLGDRLRGVWLIGSGGRGDFVPAQSDLDIQAVATEWLPEAERRQLAVSLSHEAPPCPARGLEFVLYAEQDLLRAEGPAFQLNLNSGTRMARHVALDPAEDPRFWFVIDVSIARQHARRLRGAPAGEVLPALPRALVLRALLDSIAWHREHGEDGADAVANACRAWAWAIDGRWRSKREGAEWARARRAPTQPGALEAVVEAELFKRLAEIAGRG
jgi:Domain of unknown function (DUF4111)